MKIFSDEFEEVLEVAVPLIVAIALIFILGYVVGGQHLSWLWRH